MAPGVFFLGNTLLRSTSSASISGVSTAATLGKSVERKDIDMPFKNQREFVDARP
jgi:hypothetical protein